MLARGGGGGGGAARAGAVPRAAKQVFVMLGPLVAAARGSFGHENNSPLTDLPNTGPGPGTTSAAASSGRDHQNSTVNANSSSRDATATALASSPPALLNSSSSTHQLIRNLLLQATDDQSPHHATATTTTTTTTTAYNNSTIDHDHLPAHNLAQFDVGQHLVQPASGGRGPFTSYEWLMIVTLVTIILISIVGNLLVCVAIFTDRRLRKLGNAFIVSLAIADLFVSFLVMTFALHNDLMEEWIFGAWFCDIWISFDIMCCTASILNLCAISLDRFIHIKDCLLYNQLMTRRVAISAVIMIWIISGLVSFVPITLGWHKPSSPATLTTNLPGQNEHALARAHDAAHSATTQPLPASVGGASQHAADYYREGTAGGGGGSERARRAAGFAIKHQQQIAHKLNYSAAVAVAPRVAMRADNSAGRWQQQQQQQQKEQRANEPIGSADISTPRRLQRRRLNNTTQVAVGGKDQSERLERLQAGRDAARKVESKHTATGDILMHAPAKLRHEFDQLESPTRTTTTSRVVASRAPTARPAGEKSNLGDGEPRAPPTEQIKHLPRARRRRQVAGARAAAESKLSMPNGSDYEEDEPPPPPPSAAGAEREQTEQRARSRPFDSSGLRELDSGRGQVNERQSRQPPPPSSPPAPAQCMLTLTPTYAVISSTISFYIPCIIMLGLYSKLFACARRHVRNIKAISKAPQPIGRTDLADATALASGATNNYNGGRAATAASNNHISSTGSSRSSNSASGSAGHQTVGGPLAPLVNCARRLIGPGGNQRKPTAPGARCITETNCGPDTSDKPHPGGKPSRLFGARARTWIKLRAGGGGGGSGGETTNLNSIARCAAKADDDDHHCQSVARASAVAKNNQQRESVTASSATAVGHPTQPGTGRLVLKSILSNQPKQQHAEQPRGLSEDRTVALSSASTKTAELEPFLAQTAAAAAAGGERKSVASTSALGVKLNMIGGVADAGAGVGACDAAPPANSRLQMHQNQQQQQQQLHARLQQQPLPPLQPTKQQTSQLATHKAAITLGIIMGTFLLCWLPFFCLNIIKAFYADLIPAWLFRAFTWLGYANSALNPIIYGIHNSEFRNAFNRIFFKHLTLKNGRQYLNRRFSYDLRPHHHHHHHPHHQHQSPAASVGRRPNHSGEVNNNSQHSGSAATPLVASANKAISVRPTQLVGLARTESHALQNNRPRLAASNNLHNGGGGAHYGQGRASSLAMGSSLDPGQQQQCLSLLNCLQERGGEGSNALSASNTTVHRTSEDLSGVRVASTAAQVAAIAEEQPLQQQQQQSLQPQTVAIS